MAKIFTKRESYIAKYDFRTSSREKTLMKATMDFIAYFMSLGDTKEEAETKVGEVSGIVSAYLYVYTLGNVSPLLNAINSIDENTMPFMNQAAKDNLISGLTV